MALPHAPAWYSIEGNPGLTVSEKWDPELAKDPKVVFRLKKADAMEFLAYLEALASHK